ncbi:GNAT family N-acetyltransferase [Flavobacteriaceae bacterium]|nr:GNAT family N-acetyltransferase [Flavobacteriaceae bacterium]
MKEIHLAALEPEDINLLFKLENDRRLWHVSNTLVPFSRTTLAAYLESVDSNDISRAGQYRFAIKNREETIGCIDLYDYDPVNSRAGVGVILCESARGKGIATIALKKLIQYVKEHLFLHQLYADIPVSNQLSIRLFKSCNFEKTACLKDWIRHKDSYEDQLTYQLLL